MSFFKWLGESTEVYRYNVRKSYEHAVLVELKDCVLWFQKFWQHKTGNLVMVSNYYI